MDKVINIDGVDVSGCIYFRMNNKMPMCKACNSGVGSPYCEYHKDCYYKQLKRLQAEYEDLHLTYAGCKTANAGLQELNQKLEQENERMKEENKELKSSLVRQVSTIFTLEKSSNDLS